MIWLVMIFDCFVIDLALLCCCCSAVIDWVIIDVFRLMMVLGMVHRTAKPVTIHLQHQVMIRLQLILTKRMQWWSTM
jgi:hypothetical protein